MSTSKNWFDQGGQNYARFRPEYPAELASFLASTVQEHHQALDVGCGNGQLTQLLAAHFDTVLGVDPSADQIANITEHERIRYQCAPAEKLPVADNSVNLITAAQAAHWFHLPSFYQEARRIAKPNSVLALISYGVLNLEPDLDQRFQHFYWDEIGPYWPAERKLVDEGYASLDFPFEEISAPALAIRVQWDLAQFLGYLFTWSAVRHAKEAGSEDLILQFATDIAIAWGDENRQRSIVWPINMRIGKL